MLIEQISAEPTFPGCTWERPVLYLKITFKIEVDFKFYISHI